jgi:N-acetylglucosamine-6-phosphate deacetylase
VSVAFVNGRLLTPGGLVNGRALLVAHGRIAAIVDNNDARAAGKRHDLHGAILAPGFIDAQVNGGGGVLFNETPSVATIRRIGAAHRRFGTTGFLPTLISDRPDVMHAALQSVAAAIQQKVPGVLGIHLEGPFLAPERKGIHDARHFVEPGDELLNLIEQARAGRVLVTVAPDRVPPAAIARLTRAGVVVAGGHSAATHAQARAALDAGMRGFTHLFNAMSPLQSREPGVVGAALEDANSWCSVIVDGEHVHPATLKIAIAAKPRGKVFLVTDAMPPVGSDSTSFVLNGERIDCSGGVCRSANGVLAGSALDMAAAVRNTIRLAGVPIDEALRMASTYPAEFLGIDHEVGSLEPGRRADLVALDEALTVVATWIAGETPAAWVSPPS